MKRIARVAAIAALLYLGSAQATNVLVVNITGQVFSGPSCVINGNSAGRIEASFGDALRIDRIDGNNYKVDIPFSISCTSTPSTGLRLQFSGGASTFDPAVLGTNIPDLGVKLLKPDGSQLALGEWFIFGYSPVAPALQAVPVKRVGGTLSAEPFGASTILLLEVL
ncbi:fimbrial protein [Aeromonas hydrophila]|uniref:fimbrial protein n=1 Tax=Aeromonas hydrophila TaxID=644 RepID=UPI00095468F3|nr:fimbrial protein [Aeromonas hydrophila]SIR20498.1 Fimbrial protein [Aeromonas hydrophila]SIR36870.1 Fimbrial protein [Aeromonas hydrophila]